MIPITALAVETFVIVVDSSRTVITADSDDARASAETKFISGLLHKHVYLLSK